LKIDIDPKVKEILEWVYCIIIAVVLALLVRYFIGTPTIVKQPSMFPTLKEDQRLWLSRWGRTTNKMPERGDIITFEAPSNVEPTEEELINNKLIAEYEYEPSGPIGKFVYYVLEVNKMSFIKRVIALPGEHVEIKDGKVYVNGEQLQEDYLQSGVVTDLKLEALSDFVVPENCVFVMGDNRTRSTDCRAFGCIPLEKIESKVIIRFWPLNLFGKVD
jgi:signal peptidase I